MSLTTMPIGDFTLEPRRGWQVKVRAKDLISLCLPVPNSPLQIPWPASDRKKSECAFKKKSNEVSGGEGTGALGREPWHPQPITGWS